MARVGRLADPDDGCVHDAVVPVPDRMPGQAQPGPMRRGRAADVYGCRLSPERRCEIGSSVLHPPWTIPTHTTLRGEDAGGRFAARRTRFLAANILEAKHGYAPQSSGWDAGVARSSPRCRARATTSPLSSATRARAPPRKSSAASRTCALTDSYEAILADRTIDAVVLATPHSQHEAQVLKAAGAGKHVFVEKPITLDRRSADAAVAAVRKAGLVLAVGFTRRFHPSHRRGSRAPEGRAARRRLSPWWASTRPARAISSPATTGAPTRTKRPPAR